MTVPAQVLELVERFERNLDVYKRAGYKETRVRVEFIDPFFEALGWDVHNVQGYDEQYKDVVHEDAIKVGGATRAPDYCFRVGGTRKFFLEAKKPSVSVKGDVGPAYQLRRYAWSAKLPLSILTDFEEFAVYDCRQRPKPTDKVSVGRVMYVTFDQYPGSFDDIYSVFAKESVLKGSFDRYVQDTKRKRGTGEVDAEFLREIEGWRDVLARNVALRNPALSVPELNFSVQRTIDRIIFLRMCEDRGIEDYGRLLALTGGPHIYARMHDLYRQAEEKYDSGIFDFQADTLSKTLTIDDQVLKPILASLYYPQSPYEFSVLPPEVLGQVYEQFLGKVIRLTPGHRAKVEAKPEVKKAGGVYYTPSYIVDYIVRQTVGKLVEGKTPRQIGKMWVLDPACGSGSFLLGAYQYLLDYHRRWYEEHDPLKHARGKRPAIYQTPSPSPPSQGGAGGGWRLTTAEKKRILLNNIYGVDIDRQAVEVTKLSLLLKVLEGESQETLGQQLMLWRERALPNLGDNIKCGNSLIGPDYFEAQLLPDEEEMRRVNAFEWEVEFAEVMGAGGFDCVIGNPPYVRVHRLPPKNKAYFWDHYTTFVAKSDIYACFIEKCVGLLREEGTISFITPNTWVSLESFTNLRKFVLNNTIIEQMVRTPDKVFRNATVRTFVFVLRKEATYGSGESKALIREIVEGGKTRDIRWIAQSDMESSHLHNLLLHTEDAAPALFTKCTKSGITVGTS
ncbi:MAG: N-6 DNA methylase, partial [Anaerolineae bacterium]|nr:N-6 DNA methylase [Anaerolineae bacterium]